MPPWARKRIRILAPSAECWGPQCASSTPPEQLGASRSMPRSLTFVFAAMIGFGVAGCGGGIQEGTPKNADPGAQPSGFIETQKAIGKNMQNPPREKPGQPR